MVAVAPVLPSRMTQGKDFEDARDNLIDAIEMRTMVGLREGDELPVVDGCRLAASVETREETAEEAAVHA